MSSLICEKETYEILGACFEVYKQKGCGFLEAVFQECLEIEFQLRGIPGRAQVPLALEYKGRPLVHTYVPDFVCYDRVIVELKAVSNLVDEHRAQMQNYLHASGLKVGLLVNFGHYPKVEHERFVL
jgi:GxxExxY protein